MADKYFPELSGFKTPVKITPEDILLKSPTEAGYVITRPRFTKSRMTYEFSWDIAEYEYFIFYNFYVTDLKYGTESFWIDLYLDTRRINKKVFFVSPPDMVYNGIGTWGITCKFMEV